MEYLYKLVDLINNYDGTETVERQIRDLICFLSENKEYREKDLYRTAIFEAAEKLRVFGYVKGTNRISIDEFSNDGILDVKQQTIQNYYSSKIFPNNLLDKKQKEIIDTFMQLEEKRILVSAPTSFGKTFILRELLFLNHERYKNILLVFPTIALLNENTDSIKNLVATLESEYKIVNNVYSNINENDKHIFILTPERVLKLLSDQQNLNIDFFFFDEIYKIDEDFSNDEDSKETENDDNKCKVDKGNRAKAFRITLYLLTRNVKEFYLAGPYLNLENTKYGLREYIKKNKITVIDVKFEPTMRIEIDAWKKHAVEKHPILGDNVLNLYKDRPLTTKEKIAGIIEYINNNNLGQTIFYCSTPANAMGYIHDIVADLPKNNNKINESFINHLKQKYGINIDSVTDNTAEYWSLVRAMEHGYGIHHGKFPKYIQNEILKMFNNGDFNFLFCTSTIIEGVNTKAKNVVVINNSVGNKTMSAFALKNIKGRAGRYYHHYTGRVFYTDRKQREIEKANELQLNFPTYDDRKLLDVDLDNAEFKDLHSSNQREKEKRDRTLNFDFLPDKVFVKNRLYARDIQEKYLNFILNEKEFSKFKILINNSNNIKRFLDNKMISIILESFENCGVLEHREAVVYRSVVSKYSIEGTKGIIKYHVDNHIRVKAKSNRDDIRKSLETIDKAYIDSFKQIRNIIEYEVPKLLCFFESIFSYAATLKGYNMSDFNMSPIIRFFELGITTEFGLSLVEYGFPIDTIRDIEKKFNKIGDFSTLEAITYLRKNHKKVLQILDKYELELFRAAIRSFEK